MPSRLLYLGTRLVSLGILHERYTYYLYTYSHMLSFLFPAELGDGHYWVSEPGLSITFPLKFVGDEHNASNVVVELSGTIAWKAKAGWVEGVTFRRPKISSGEGSTEDMLRIGDGGRIDMVHSVIDNAGSSGASVVTVDGDGSGGRWEGVVISGGREQGVKLNGSKIELKQVREEDQQS